MTDYPLSIKQREAQTGSVQTRAAIKRVPLEIGKTNVTKNSCISDAVRIWNLAPDSVTGSDTIYSAKKAIKSFVKSLPI